MVLWRNVNEIKETWKTKKYFSLFKKQKISADKKRKKINFTYF